MTEFSEFNHDTGNPEYVVVGGYRDSFVLCEARIRLKRIMEYYHTLLLRGINIIPSKTRCEQCLSTNEFKCRGSYSICRVDEVLEENKPFFVVISVKFLEDLQRIDDLQKKQTPFWRI